MVLYTNLHINNSAARYPAWIAKAVAQTAKSVAWTAKAAAWMAKAVARMAKAVAWMAKAVKRMLHGWQRLWILPTQRRVSSRMNTKNR